MASKPAARTDEQRAEVEAMADFLTASGAVVVSLFLLSGIANILPFY